METPLSPERQREVLRERARMLAAVPDSGEHTHPRIEVVEFLLASERYALESRFVREVCHLKQYTPLPCTPAFVLGLINVRSQVVSVIDIRKFFDLPERGISDLNRVIIVRSDAMELGILADAIVGVKAMLRESVRPALATMSGVHSDFVRGITREGITVLDIERVLSDKRIIVHEEIDE
jgi:purine-binding chemotaxis protein CheW